MTQATLLKVKAGRGLVLKSRTHICSRELLLLRGPTFLSGFLTLIIRYIQMDFFIEGNCGNALEVCSSILLGTEKQNALFLKNCFWGEDGYNTWSVQEITCRMTFVCNKQYHQPKQFSLSLTYSVNELYLREYRRSDSLQAIHYFSNAEKDGTCCIFLWYETSIFSECGFSCVFSLLKISHAAKRWQQPPTVIACLALHQVT